MSLKYFCFKIKRNKMKKRNLTFFRFIPLTMVLNLLCAHLYAGTANLISPGATWKYLDNGTDQGMAWIAPLFNDASWSEGSSELGYGDGGEATVVSFGPDANNKYITTYFRKTLNVADVSILKSLLVGIRADDGAVVYINGIEVARHNMPAGAIAFNTLAPGNIAGHFENVYHHFNISPSLLVNGTNVIAVEIHQDDVTSSDLSFNFELIASTEGTFIARGDEWKYLDNGSNQGTSWKDVLFDDSPWASGKAILGYNSTAGSRLENTTVSYGPSASNKYITTYFRKTITIADTSAFGQFQLNMYLDDGAVIYINGVESNRINLPAGTISFTTTASSAIGTAAWNSYTINKTLFRNGVNVIAVEVHQQAITSSDMNFEMELKEEAVPPAPGGGCTSQEIGCFTSLALTCQSPGLLVLPSTHTYQVIMQQGDPYLTGGGSMPTNNDFTAFIPINGSSELGYLSINHENNPGGVSILDMHYNPYTGLWEVDNSQAVSFSEVVKTERNCSGGITPWGTVVTSEEAVTGGDANGDGYTDIGWHVEINPITKEIIDYNNDGLSDKIWAMGRSTKENICFHSDMITSYFGLDAGATSYIYKFVADAPGNLSAGTLYVLKQNVYLGNTAFWVQVPNTTQADRNNCVSLCTGLGATSFNKVEDVEIGGDGKIYFTSSNEGRVYRFSDSPSINDFEIFIDKQNYSVNDGSGITSALFNNCDNLAFDPIENNLWVNVDGNCNYLWMARPNHTSMNPQIELFARIPSGAESTGTTFSPDGRFMFLSIQHPSANSVNSVDAAGYNHIINKATTVVIARKEHLGVLAAIPFIELGNDLSICQGQNLVLDAGAGHASYLWSTGETTQSISVSTAGTYSVLVTGANGRTNNDQITITVLSGPTAPAAVSTSYCVGETINPLTASGSNINWYSDAGLTNHVASGSNFNTGNINAGTYNYFATQTDGNGCQSASTPVTLTINNLPSSPIAANQNACEGSTISNLSATGSSINWFSDAGLSTLVHTGNIFSTGNTASGTYTYYVTQTDVNNCSSLATLVTQTINPQPSIPTISGNTVYCEGQSIQTLSGTGTNIKWYSNPAHTILVGTGSSFTPFISSTSTFYVTSTSASGCVSNDAIITVTIHPLPAIPTASNMNACEGSTIPDLTATGSNLEWFSDAALTNSVANGTNYATGMTTVGTYTYYVVQTDGNNCTSNPQNVSLTINSVPTAPVITGDLIYCQNETLTALTATGTTVFWYSDAALTTTVNTGNQFTPSITTSSSFYVNQVSNGCESPVTTVTVTINPLPTVSFTGLNAVYMLNDPSATLIGSPAGGVFSGPGVSGNSFIPSLAGIGGPYFITYTYTDPSTGCTNSVGMSVSVDQNNGLITISDQHQFQLFPNPTKDQSSLIIHLGSNATVELNLYDISGRVISIQQPTTLVAGKHEIKINKNELGLAAGTYWLKVNINQEEKTIKLIFTN